jgi:glutamate/tyrosine decarboxylase-like PLP-dependent enzyme
MDERTVLARTAGLAADFLGSLDARPVGVPVDSDGLHQALGGPLPDVGEDSLRIVETLAREADPGIVASAGPRYFGFVVGGSFPAAVAADWLTSAWDQNAGLFAMAPAAMVVEEVAGRWLKDLLGLPAGASVGFVSGATMANWTSLATARHAMLERLGWNVETRGLYGAPELDVVIGAEAHVTILAALQYLGLGRERVHVVPVDGQGRMRADELAAVLARCRPHPIVCVQAGNVATGAFDPLEPIAEAVRTAEGWLHVDGAFGLWAAASPALRPLTAGLDRADSWTTDAHKWLNVPYDSGLAFTVHPASHRAATSLSAAYLVEAESRDRDGDDWVPEYSRRARAFPIYATIRALGRSGVAELVERCCRLARRMADRLGQDPAVTILNDVVLNQVLVRVGPDGETGDAWTRQAITGIQRDGTCWLGGTEWHGRAAMRISVSNWRTTDADIDASADAILRAVRATERGGGSVAGTS